jgi:hypothetical protein
VPENGLQLLEFQRRGDAEHSFVPVKAAIRQEDMAMGIKSEGVAEGLDCNDCARDGSLFRYGLLHENLQGFPGATAKGGKKFSIIQKVPAENLRDAEDKMPVGYLFEDINAEPFAEFHHTFLVARGAKMPSFTRKRQQVFVAAVFTFDAGKTIVQIAAIEITIDYFFDIGPPESVLPRETVIVFLHKGFKIILHAVVIIRILRLAGVV